MSQPAVHTPLDTKQETPLTEEEVQLGTILLASQSTERHTQCLDLHSTKYVFRGLFSVPSMACTIRLAV